MPSVEELVPYLREMDRDLWYTNFGPKLDAFEEGLASHFCVNEGSVVTTTSATAGLTLALKSIRTKFDCDKEKFSCLLPGWTFVASAQAVLEAGGVPIFCDVDSCSGDLTPRIVKEYIDNQCHKKPDVIMPVAPYGGHVDVPVWDELSEEVGLPVVIDGAASFYSVEPGLSPVVVSLHATKAFGIGEGGLVVSLDSNVVRDIRQASQFGFKGGRVALSEGGNYKLSEYHASVGLAQFSRQEEVKSSYKRLRKFFLSQLATIEGVDCSLSFNRDLSTTINVSIEGWEASKAVSQLRGMGIGAAVWWEDKLYENPIFNPDNQKYGLKNSDTFYSKVFALPFHTRITNIEIMRILDGVETLI